MKIVLWIILFLCILVEILVIKVCASYTQLPLKHRINLGSTVVNIGHMILIPTSNVISTTFHTFLHLTVLPETSIPWRYDPTEHIQHTTPTISYEQGFYSRQYWSCEPDSNSNVISTTSRTFLVLTVLHETSIPIGRWANSEAPLCGAHVRPEVLDFCVSRYFPN